MCLTMKYVLLFLAIICAWVSSASTVNPESFMLFNTGNGKLKHNTVETLCRDQMGFLWVGTNFGLNRLDGYTTINYTNNPEDTTSISANFIKCVYNDSKNNLWVGTMGGGLNLYDRKNNSFVRFQPSPSKNSISSLNITSITEDREGNIWLGTATKIINKYIVDKDSFVVYDLDAYDYLDRGLSSVHKILCDKNGVIWVGMGQGEVFRINPKNEDIKLISTPRKEDVVDIGSIFGMVELNDNMLFSTWKGKIYSVNLRNDTILSLHYKPEMFENAILSEIGLGVDNDLWVASRNKGLFKVDVVKNEVVERYNYNKTSSMGIGSNSIGDLYIDADNNLWLGYLDNGVGMFPIVAKMFSDLSPIIDKDKFERIYAIVNDDHGNIWFGSRGGGLWKYNKSTESFKNYDANDYDGLNCNYIISLKWSSNDNKLYIGTLESFVSIFDPEINRFHQIQHNKDDWSSAVFAIDENDSYVFAATWGGGVKKIDKKDLLYTSINFDKNDQVKNSVLDISLQNDVLWVANVGMGLIKHNLNKQKFEVLADENQTWSLPSERINTIYVQNDTIIWLGAGGKGVYKYNISSKKVVNHIKNESVAQNVIQAIDADQNNNIWITTIAGIFYYDLKSNTRITFNKRNGLVNDNFNLNSLCFDSEDNRFYAGGIDGVDYFQTNNIIVDSTVNEVVFTGLNVMGESIRNPNKTNLRESIEVAEKVHLHPGENIISVNFSSFDFSPSQRNCYEYKLEGFNDKWVRLPYDKNSVSYTNLDPGKHVLKVRACNSDGVMGQSISELSLIVLPAFWQTIWFYVLVSVLLIGLGYLYYNIRNRKLIKSKKKLEIKVQNRTKEILKQKIYIEKQNAELEQANLTKDKFFSIIGHDLRNPMANVNQLVDLIINEFNTASKEQIMSYLEVLQRSSETTIKLLDDLLIWSRTQNGKMEAENEIIAVKNLFDATIETCQLTAGKKNIQINNLNEDNLNVVCDENMMLTVLRNIVTNAIKFSFPNSEIFLNAHQRGRNVVVSIADEGKGMSENQLSNLFKIESVSSTEGTGGEIGSGLGLIICKEFVHANNGRIWVESEKDVGATFFISLPGAK